MATNPYAAIAIKEEENPYAKIAIKDDQPPPPESFAHQAGEFGKNIAKGLGESAVGLMSSADEFARKHLPAFMTNKNFGFGAPADLENVKQMATPVGTTQAVTKGIGDVAQFFIPGGAEEKAIQYAGAIPKVGKAAMTAAKILAPALSSGAVNAAQGGDFKTGAALGAAGPVIGQGLKALSPAMAETALKVRGNQRLFGRTVGDAILNDTKGIRPETVGKSAKATIARLTPELEAADQASAAAGQRGSMAPAREAVQNKIGGYQANRAMNTAAEIQPVADFLKTDQLTGLPLAEKQAAPGLRSVKRGLTSDFIGPWKPEESIERKQAARSAYGKLNEELHAISPGTKEIDQRISSLIPVMQQGERVAAGAPMTQRVMGRFGAHSGALAGGLAGGFEGKREAGIPGAIAGGLFGLMAPEVAASPEGQMAIARMMSKAKNLRVPVGMAAQFTPRRENQ